MPAQQRPPLPEPQDLRNLDDIRTRVIEETILRTKNVPHSWQTDEVLNRLAGKDTFTIAPTGAGKSLTFAMLAFVLRDQAITWILAPLNVIQEQQARVFSEGWGIPSICINSSTNLERAKRKILAGEYQIVISSPENFFDSNKLRKIVMSNELTTRRHFGDQFRTAYGSCGNLRGMLFGVPFSAVTATATQSVKVAIISALHLGSDRPLVFTNLGNYRRNIKYSLFVMKGGLNLFDEIALIISSRGPLVPTLVFTNHIPDTQRIADAIRKKLNWRGKLAYKFIAYHSLRDESGKQDAIKAFQNGDCIIIVAAEALTMRADFSNVGLVIRHGRPGSATTLAQQCGRAARREEIQAEAIVMIIQSQYQKAVAKCSGISDVHLDDIKLEVDGLATRFVQNEKASPAMDMDIARFITTKHMICATKTGRTTSALLGVPRTRPETNQIHMQLNEWLVVGNLLKRRLKRMSAQGSKAEGPLDEQEPNSETCYTGLEDIMTEKALESIAKCKSIKDVHSFDNLHPVWPQKGRWGEEVVMFMKELSVVAEEMQQKAAEEKKQKAENAREAAKKARKIEEGSKTGTGSDSKNRT
ncbi:Helicase conserved C-terminal domain [Ceratobasidium sp. AG-Ba]|nr:Helicase conserved C-terminal domain [Ceratobasidium sp. AG-Ba]